MILLGITCIIGFILLIFTIQWNERRELKKYAKTFLEKYGSEISQNQAYTDSNIETESDIQVYFYKRDLNELKPIDRGNKALEKEDLNFLNFPVFMKFIDEEKQESRIFGNKDYLYLFFPIKLESGLEYLIFGRKAFSIERIVRKK
jgi:hypothetical protein